MLICISVVASPDTGQVGKKMAESNVLEQEKCVYCMLVENLYPEKIAASLYEDSGLSSGTLEEVTLTEGVSRRAVVKTILKKLSEISETTRSRKGMCRYPNKGSA